MITGTANVDDLARLAPTMPGFPAEPIDFEGVTCLQLIAEMHNGAREAVLPPSLHPTIPPALSLQAWEIEKSPFGTFSMVICRVSCRAGVRARGLTSKVYVDQAQAAEGLRTMLGFPASVASLSFSHSYSGAEVVVRTGDTTVLDIHATDPQPMGLTDVQYTGTLNLAHTPMGLRLIQLEAQHDASRVDRLTASLRAFDGAAWGNALFDPYYVVSAAISRESVSFAPVRFVCKPGETAFTGTQAVAS